MRYFCTAQSVIRQAAVTLGDLETRSFGEFSILLLRRDAPLRNKGVGGCARRLAGCRKVQGKICAPFVREVRTFQVSSKHLGYINRVVNYVFPHFQL